MKIGILHTGIVPESLQQEYISYAQMFIDLLGSRSNDFEFKIYEVLEMAFPENVDECDGWIITGSKYGVYENHPWIKPLSALVRSIAANKSPMLGVCFGHQLIAQALGGKVENSSKGWGLGFDTYTIENKPDYMANMSDSTLILNIFHQDQVVSLPEGATVFAKSDFCENAGFYIENHVLTIQAHPEFSLLFSEDLLRFYRGSSIPVDVIDLALEQLKGQEGKITREFLGSIKNFFLPVQA